MPKKKQDDTKSHDPSIMDYSEIIVTAQDTCYGDAFTNEKLGDVVFSVGSEDEVAEFVANRTVLAVASPEFASMLFVDPFALDMGDLKSDEMDEKATEAGQITVDPNARYTSENPLRVSFPNVKPLGFVSILRYCYHLDPHVNSKNVVHVIDCCEEFTFPNLAKKCAEFVASSLNADQFSQLFEQAVLADSGPIMEACIQWLEKRPDQHGRLMKTDGFKNWHPKVMTIFVESNSIGVTEDTMFERGMEWAKEQKHMPQIDAEQLIVRNVRWIHSDPEKFVKEIIPRNFFSREEHLLILKRMFDKNTAVPEEFARDPRRPAGPFCVQRYGNLATDVWSFGGSKDAINVKCDCAWKLVGVGVNTALQEPYNTEVTLTIYDFAERTKLASAEADFKGEEPVGTEDTLPRIDLDKPLDLEKDKVYQIQILQRGNQARRSNSCKTSVTITHGTAMTFVFSAYRHMCDGGGDNGTGTSSGQIPTLWVLYDY